jgi:hypothetical protein
MIPANVGTIAVLNNGIGYCCAFSRCGPMSVAPGARVNPSPSRVPAIPRLGAHCPTCMWTNRFSPEDHAPQPASPEQGWTSAQRCAVKRSLFTVAPGRRPQIEMFLWHRGARGGTNSAANQRTSQNSDRSPDQADSGAGPSPGRSASAGTILRRLATAREATKQ